MNATQVGNSESNLAEVLLTPDERSPTTPTIQSGRFVNWEYFDRGAYRAEVRASPESAGGYTAYVPGLPGVASEGDTLNEALENIKEALEGALATYLEAGEDIPWKSEAAPDTHGEIRRWIVVHV